MLPVLNASRRLVLSALVAASLVAIVPLSVTRADAQSTGNVSGTARTASGQTMDNATVQLRDLQSGQLVGTTETDDDGRFSFVALNPGNYAVELVSASGEIVGASAAVLLTSTSMVASGLTVTAASTLAAVGAGSFFTSTWGIITMAAIGAGVVGLTVAATTEDASPFR